MPSASSVQVAQFGIDNKFVQGEPSMTFFKSVVKKHTNFATETMAVNFDNPPEMGSINTITIPRNGDLVRRVHLKVYYPEIQPTILTEARWCSGVAQALVEYAELVIGGEVVQHIQDIEAFTQSEYRTPDGHYPALQTLENRYPVNQLSDVANLASSGTFYTQLFFYFHWHTSLALPLVALKYQEIQIRLKFRNVNELVQTTDGINIANEISGPDTQALMKFTPCVEYIFLDDAERNRYMSGKQYDYIIEQNQRTTLINDATRLTTIPLKGMVKELVLIFRDKNIAGNTAWDGGNNYFNLQWQTTPLTSNDWTKEWTMSFNHSAIIQLALSQLTAYYGLIYFKYMQPLEYHTRVPGTNMYSLSFSHDPESLDPTGAANFSRIRSVVTYIQKHSQYATLYATSINIYRICDNLGALVFKE